MYVVALSTFTQNKKNRERERNQYRRRRKFRIIAYTQSNVWIVFDGLLWANWIVRRFLFEMMFRNWFENDWMCTASFFYYYERFNLLHSAAVRYDDAHKCITSIDTICISWNVLPKEEKIFIILIGSIRGTVDIWSFTSLSINTQVYISVDCFLFAFSCPLWCFFVRASLFICLFFVRRVFYMLLQWLIAWLFLWGSLLFTLAHLFHKVYFLQEGKRNERPNFGHHIM